MLFEVGKEIGVGERLQAGGVVSHDVGHPGNEECFVAVAVASLVHARDVA